MEGFSLLSVLILFGAAQGLILVIAINRIKNRNRDANRILSAFILLISLVLLSRLVYVEGVSIWTAYPHLFLIPDIPLLLYGPIFYFYIRSLLMEPQAPAVKWWVHFIPAALHILLMSFYLLESRAAYFQRLVEGDLWEVPYVGFIALGQMAIYLWMSYRIFNTYRKRISNKVSFNYSLKYLQVFFLLTAICWLAWFYSSFASLARLIPAFAFIDYNFAWVSLSFTTFILAYFAMSQQEIFKLNPQVKKYEGSSLSGEALKEIEKKLLFVMQTQKPYLNKTLTLGQLAELIAVHQKDLSQVINAKFGMNFFDFINSYRVAEFKALACQEKYRHLTVLAIAYDAGFNSKTTFNTAFKKFTGITPVEYLKIKD